jgi:hypothetical protein
MGRYLALVLAVGLSMTLHTGVQCANINDLADAYEGPLSSTNSSSFEEGSLAFTVKTRQSNGGFIGVIPGLEIPIQGKVNTSGKFSFSGEGAGTSGKTTFDIKIKGKGQLSATGRFIGGTANLKGVLNGSSVNVNYIFYLEEASVMGLQRRGSILGL